MGPIRVDGIITKNLFVSEKLFSVIQIMPFSKYLKAGNQFFYLGKTSVKQ